MNTRISFKPTRLGFAAVLWGLLATQSVQANPSYEYRALKKGLAVSSSSSGNPAAQLSSSSLAFGGVALGASEPRQVALTNTGGTSLAVSSVQTTGAGFSASTSCPALLAAGQSCLATVLFTPTSGGAYSGSLSWLTSLGQPLTVSLSGTGQDGQGTLAANTSTDFGSVAVGQSATRSFTFTNNGATALNGVYATLVGSGLALESNTCGTQASPLSVSAGSTCTMTVRYSPTMTGALSGAELRVASSASNSPSSLALQATGTPSDPNHANVALFMSMDGTVGGGIATSADATGKAVISTGSPAAYSATSAFGQSAYLSTAAVGGDGGCVTSGTTTLEVARNSAFELDTSDYTLEMRVRPSGLSGYQGLLSNYESCTGVIRGWAFFLSGNRVVLNRANGADQVVTFSSSLTSNTWYHLALVKQGNTVSLYVNGVKDATVGTLTGDYVSTINANTRLRVGSVHTVSATGLVGHLDEIRMTRGVARYTANFTPNTTALTYP